MKKWILPALLTGGLALLLWWLVSKPGALPGLSKFLSPIDPNATIATALCEAGVVAYGGMTAGMAGLPLCTALGPALGPVVKGATDLAVNLLDGGGDVVGAVVSLHTGAIYGAEHVVSDVYSSSKDVVHDAYSTTKDVVHDAYDSTKDVVHDLYSGGKTVVVDTYNVTKDVVLAPVHVAKKVLSFFGL